MPKKIVIVNVIFLILIIVSIYICSVVKLDYGFLSLNIVLSLLLIEGLVIGILNNRILRGNNISKKINLAQQNDTDAFILNELAKTNDFILNLFVIKHRNVSKKTLEFIVLNGKGSAKRNAERRLSNFG